MLANALDLFLGVAFVVSIVLAFLATRTWRLFWAIVALAVLAVIVILLWPGNLLNQFWFPPAGAGGASCAQLGDMIERDVNAKTGENSLVCGPAIYEQPGVIGYVAAGNQIKLVGIGSWWSFPSQASLDARWPKHRDDFLVKCTKDGWNCVVNGPMPVTDAVAPTTAAPLAVAPPTTGHFPGTAPANAIVQWWDGGAGCGIALTTEPLTYEGQGTWWSSQGPDDYVANKAAYVVANPGCSVDTLPPK